MASTQDVDTPGTGGSFLSEDEEVVYLTSSREALWEDKLYSSWGCREAELHASPLRMDSVPDLITRGLVSGEAL